MIAYMIMCHKNRKQVNRLLAALKSNNSVCFVHVDTNADFQPSEIRGGVLTEHRYHGILGDYSLVQIADELILTAKKYEEINNVEFQYFCLLSGQDYLVVPVEKSMSSLKRVIQSLLLIVRRGVRKTGFIMEPIISSFIK